MTQNKYTTNGRKFKHLTKEKRAQIEILLQQGLPKAQIAKAVGIARSTLYNELKRGTVEQMDSQLCTYTRYFSDVGQRVYQANRENSRPCLKFIKAHEFLAFAERKILQDGWSPDVVCGWAQHKGRFTETVCTKTLYNYIDQCLLRVRNIDLPLRVKRKTKRQKNQQNRRLYGLSIEERPEKIQTREEFGHWEFDTVIGLKGSSAALLSMDERQTRKRILIKISSKTSEAVGEAVRQLKEKYAEKFPRIFRSITCDNGSEFASLPQQLPDTPIYYAHPYSAYERGTNEKQNSLVRRFFPKGKSLDGVSEEAIKHVEDWINHLPRKMFHYTSSEELFQSVLFDIAI